MNEFERHDRSGEEDALASRAAAEELTQLPIEDLLEACRPDGDELSQPEFALVARRLAEQPQLRERLHRLQASDRQIGSAFRAVEVPLELADRIRAALAAAAPADPEVIAHRGRRFGRRLRWTGALVATAAALLLGISWLLRSPASYSADSIADQAQRMLIDVDQLDFEAGTPLRIALPPQLAQANVESWRTGRFLEREATFVRLERNGVRGTLIVAPLRGGPAITGKLPRTVYTTGQWAIGVLPDNKRLCVLAVRGDAAAYRQFLESGAVAVNRPRLRVVPVSRSSR